MKKNQSPRYAAQSRLDGLEILGIKTTDVSLDFFLSDKAKSFAKDFFKKKNVGETDLVISVSPTSRRHFNRWNLERYASVCDFLVSKYKVKIILVWGPGERPVVDRLNHLSKSELTISPPTPTLQELGAILQGCDLHLGNDNGTKHVAVAVGIPTLTIFGPNSQISWTYPDKRRHRRIQAESLCKDCERVKHRCKELSCLDSIQVDFVKEKLEEFLKDNLDERKLKKAYDFRTD
jgi:ADP-heptose:LPS heptosyltransferase